MSELTQEEYEKGKELVKLKGSISNSTLSIKNCSDMANNNSGDREIRHEMITEIAHHEECIRRTKEIISKHF